MVPLALTVGDPAGVGPEILATWAGLHPDEARDTVVLAAPKLADWLREASGGALPVEEMAGHPPVAYTPGRPTEDGARFAWSALEAVALGTQAGLYRGAVTGSVAKSWLQRVGYPYPGQTEFFAARWGGEPTMGFVGRLLRVVLATWHIPLREVSRTVTPEVLGRAVERAGELARRLGVAEPRIGVCGLNPHAGEEGILGTEEVDTLNPALDSLRAQWPGLSRCLPGDTVFWRARQGDFDVVVALYHDQGLGPLKTLEFESAVNVTLGLPFVRTSPDHGTAFSLAGKGQADIGSWAEAVRLARRLTAT